LTHHQGRVCHDDHLGDGNDSGAFGPQHRTIKISLDTGFRSRSGCVSGAVLV
jgi:hypothetical protein